MPECRTDYQKQLEKTLEGLEAAGQKPKLLLHACCGPCSSYVLEYLYQHFEITVLYYNPNIYPQEEYERRLNELKSFYTRFEPASKVSLVELAYNPEEFYTATGARENPELAKEAERGERCRRCYELRLRKTQEYAVEHGFDYFCTTLSISPFKDADMINKIGEQLGGGALRPFESLRTAEPQGPQIRPLWLTSDFKKKNGFKRSLELSAEYGLYRQEYCGCIYSIRDSKNAHS